MESEQQVIEDEDEDFLTPRTFVVPEESDATKSTIEELDQVILIKYMPEKKVDEKLYQYLAVSEIAVSGVIVREEQSTQFPIYYVTEFLEAHKIKRILSTSYNPTGNGKAESTNKTIIHNLKKQFDDAKGKWREVLPEVLWAYWTTSKTSMGATLFSLVYGSESLFPIKVGEPSFRFQHASKETNHEAMNTNLELIDEKREAMLDRMVMQKQRIERYYNRRTNLRHFGIRDLVLRKVILNTRDPNKGKLGQN
uniref:Integrase catalytic domain-containing protein n=1 Tax=Nicotiana tabacum TaxID=4097 RepID=A0A1S4B2C0_TOBAC|nr:PREDICTED: uncharacterized protein LOC107803720 [Nicotiana tabacum]